MFSIIIPSWNNLPYLRACVESIRLYSAHPHQIIIHLNEGIDGSLEWVQANGLDYTHSQHNIGICYAVNQAFAVAKHDYIVYLNDDMLVLPNWDSALLATAKAYPDHRYMLSGTLIEPRDTGNQCVIVADYGQSLESLDMPRLLSEYTKHPKADWSGSSWPPVLLHRSTWLLIGGFSTELSPGMYSDPDLSMKLWAAGFRIFKGVGASRVYHFQAKSTGRAKRNNGRLQFMGKWGISASFFYKHYLLMGQKWKNALELPHKSEKWERVRVAFLQLWQAIKA